MKNAALILLSVFLAGCSLSLHPRTGYYVNPDFPCPTDKIVEPGQGYPYPIRQDADGSTSVAALKEFCREMRQRFSQSKLTATEAIGFYSLLRSAANDQIPWLHNECYGMPGCQYEPFVFEKQVMIKKIKYHLNKGGNVGCFLRASPAKNTPHPFLLR